MIKIEDLVEKVKNGDKEAYSKLIDSIKDLLFSIARKKLNNEDDVQDVMQETIIKAYLNIHRLKNNKNFKAWIIKILINECNKTYYKHKRNERILEKYTNNTITVSYTHDDSDINFDNLISSLNDKEKSIFELHYKHGLTSKQIANKLNLNENTVKTTLSRGKIKLRRTLKPTTLLIAILILFIAGGVAAACIISYIKEMFKVSDSSMENDGVLMAIEHLDWYQETKMDYIDLGEGYKIKFDYLLMDEMNLYLVVDLKSENDLSKFKHIYFPDLKITNEKGDVICDESDVLGKHYSKRTSVKSVETTSSHIKALIYMYTDSFPISRTLNIEFSKIILYKNLNNRKYINTNASFEIELEDKFINRHSISYISNDESIEKAIVTETGFYAIIDNSNLSLKNVKLIDEFKNYYECYFSFFTNYDNTYIIMANFNNLENKLLKIMIDNKEYELYKN